MTTKVILFPQDSTGSVAIMASTGALDPMQTAIKDVPAGVPFIIVDVTDIPQGVPQEALVVDFSEPDGYVGNVLPAAPVEKVNSTEDIEQEEINYGTN
jgi:hypothetical protein